jgi:hypothetical protein
LALQRSYTFGVRFGGCDRIGGGAVEEVSVADLLAGVLLVLVLLVFLGIALVFLACVGWVLFAVIALVGGRRPRTSYGRQLRAAERGGHRRRRRSGRNFPGITIFLDTRPPGLHKREP